MEERGVPKPRLGKSGVDLSREDSSRSSGRRGAQVQEDNPETVLELSESYNQLLDQLRDSYIVFKENSSRCKIQLRPKRKSARAPPDHHGAFRDR